MASMTTTEMLVGVLVIAAVVIVPLVISQVLADRKQRRSIIRLRTRACPHCHVTYGVEAVIRIASSLWNPAPGYRVSQLDLPNPSYFATCSQCAQETEHREDGRVFELPAEGVLSRTIIFPV